MKRIRLAVMELIDACAMMRGAMPLGLLARAHGELDLIRHDRWGWPEMCACDAVFMSRPQIEGHLHLLQMAKQLQIPIVLEYDDAFDVLPPSNPNYISPDRLRKLRQICRESIALADMVWCSTAGVKDFVLRMRLEKLASPKGQCFLKAENVHVIPNAHNDKILGFAQEKRSKVVTWRGTNTHSEDVLSVLPAIAEVSAMDKFKEWDWVFLGDPPYQTMQQIPKADIRNGWQSYFDYLGGLIQARPFLHIAPLADNEFNRAKSNLVWMEATVAGAVTLAPNFPEFKLPGVVNYDPEKIDDFKEQLMSLMKEFNGCLHPKVRESQLNMEANLSLSAINEARWDLLQRVVGK